MRPAGVPNSPDPGALGLDRLARPLTRAPCMTGSPFLLPGCSVLVRIQFVDGVDQVTVGAGLGEVGIEARCDRMRPFLG